VTTAARRFESRRAQRDRAVYVAEPFCLNVIDDPGGRKCTHLGVLYRHEPFAPLAGTLLRPFGDAATALQALLRR
jgi:hypothetical protein